MDTSKIKPPRLKYESFLPLKLMPGSDLDSRHGQLEDRDPYRLKDRNGDPILCFRCGLSALSHHNTPVQPKRPRKASQKPANAEGWKSIVSCDYCDLSWHLDCLDPPLDSMPLFGIKWMCPNHADQVYVCHYPSFFSTIYGTETWPRNQNGGFRNNTLDSLKSPNPVNGTTAMSRLCRVTTLPQRNKRFWLMKSRSTGGGTEFPNE